MDLNWLPWFAWSFELFGFNWINLSISPFFSLIKLHTTKHKNTLKSRVLFKNKWRKCDICDTKCAMHVHSHRVRKAIYGLKQTPRACFKKFNLIISCIRFARCHSDHSLFVHCTKSGSVILAVYVDRGWLSSSQRYKDQTGDFSPVYSIFKTVDRSAYQSSFTKVFSILCSKLGIVDIYTSAWEGVFE